MKNRLVWLAVAALVAAGCSGEDGKDGKNGATGPQGPPGEPGPTPPPTPTDPNIAEGQALPGAVLVVTSLAGATGAGGQFQAGDPVRVTFTLNKGDGSYLGLDELNSGSIYISGPTNDYQRVIPRRTDLRAASVKNADGSYTYTFPAPFPAVYAAPYNDTAAFGATDGEKTGQALANGTYTLGIEGYKSYFEGTEEFRDLINVTRDFLFGTATVLAPRELVTEANCNACHDNLRVHGGFRSDVKLCVLCHTAGAEDRDSATPPDLTPGTSIELKVMIHKLHNAKHLPSVLGFGTKADGTGDRDYGLTPRPYEIKGFSGVVDYSDIGFPVWPNLNVVMPRDGGYTLLSSTVAPGQTLSPRGKDDESRRGVTACAKCHGDPDKGGPLPAPVQGDFAYSQQTRRACGSCHDDIDWAQPYKANGVSMPAQTGDTGCTTCHPASGTSLSPVDAHVHPLTNPSFFPGLNFAFTSLADGSGDLDGKVEPGEKVRVSFTMKDDAGADVPLSTLTQVIGTSSGSMNFSINGPTTNQNLVYYGAVPLAGVPASVPAPGGAVTTMNLPQAVYFDFAGTSTGALESFTTSRTPHWNVSGAPTTVQVRTGVSNVSFLTAAAAANQNYIDVFSPAGWAKGDVLVIDDGIGGKEEYLRVQLVEGNRVWFASYYQTFSTTFANNYQPFLRTSHAAAAVVQEVTLVTKATPADYTLNAATGTITEVTEFGAGNKVVVTYVSDFVMPAAFPGSFNDNPALDETWGEWVGRPLADGTYTLTLWGVRRLQITASGEATDYSGSSKPGVKNFLVGAATSEVPYSAISSKDNCYRCHDDMYFHGGGRRDFETCLSCHGNSGSEDWPVYRGGTGVTNNGVTVSFRTMLHKIHMGKELPDASTYVIFGNNGSANDFEEIGFPELVNGVSNCSVCHGDANTNWQSPPDRTHPAGQVKATRSWRATCGSCHSKPEAQAHIDANTATNTNGAESCAVCHGAGKEWNVPLEHFNR